MTRAEFVRLYADLVAIRRQEVYPDTRRSEAAMNRLSDLTSAARVWRKHRASLKPLTAAEWRAQMDAAKPTRLFLVPPTMFVQ